MTTPTTDSISFTPLSPTIGSEVTGIDLRERQPDDVIATLRAALVDRKVLFFRNQPLTTEHHLDFGRRFGELEVHPFVPSKPGYPEVLDITHDENAAGKENLWHSDVTWRLQPSLGSILLNKENPGVGGDTLFADMEAAYDGLTTETKDKIDGLNALHDSDGFRALIRSRGASEEAIAKLVERFPPAIHPVVRTHPESGRRSLYVNGAFTKHIVGMDQAESDALLQNLYRQANFPEYQCRFRWEQFSIAFWDNRACQHYATSDYYPARRCAERVTIVGSTPAYDPTIPRRPTDQRFKGSIQRLTA